MLLNVLKIVTLIDFATDFTAMEFRSHNLFGELPQP